MMELLSCRYNMDTAIQLFNAAAASLDCISPIYYLYVALIFISLRFHNKTKVAGIVLTACFVLSYYTTHAREHK